MNKFEVHASLKFRKSIFSLFFDLVKVSIVSSLLSIFLSFISFPVPTLLFFLVFLIICMLGVCISWHLQIVEVQGNILAIKSGFWFREKKSFSMEYIQEIKVKQTLIGKYLKYGDLVITAPTIDESIIIKDLDNVKRLSRVLNDYARDNSGDGFVITGN